MKAKIREERVCYLMCTPFSYYICYLENLAEEWWWTGDTKTPDLETATLHSISKNKAKEFLCFVKQRQQIRERYY